MLAVIFINSTATEFGVHKPGDHRKSGSLTPSRPPATVAPSALTTRLPRLGNAIEVRRTSPVREGSMTLESEKASVYTDVDSDNVSDCSP